MGKDGFAQVLAHFFGIDVKRGGKFDVADVIPPQVGVHQAGDERILSGVFVILNALYERGRAVAHADDGDSDFAVHGLLLEIGIDGSRKMSAIFLYLTNQ